ncbi:MAG: hypothetical protein KJ799_16850 [Bacteroidetes bacterium]|nr:hypothetical protein [Bacteroidota bacterium]MBU1678253.1 hypothetical protein [Bacteroidota bacterium]MBU2508368.1 hypothetical protein [Bacteroidota bacterium]
MKIKYVLFFSIIFFNCFYSQNIDKIYKKIQNKLQDDDIYLDLYAVNYYPAQAEASDVKTIPLYKGDNFAFEPGEGISYKFIYLNETIETDSLILVEIRKYTDASTTGEGGIFGSVGEASISEDFVVTFRDMQELYFENRSIYNQLLTTIIKLLRETEPQSLLKLDLEKDNKKSRGISAKDNLDYLNFAWVNSKHKYPPLPEPATGVRSVRRGRSQASTDSPFEVSWDIGKTTFFYKDFMDYDFSRISVELNMQNSLLNLHPWQTMTMGFGIRNLIFLTQNVKNMQNDFLIDTRIIGRFRLNTSGFASSIPFVFTEDPKLNVGPGIEVDLSLSRAFGFPFMNLYYSAGSEDVTTPYVKVNNAAYFTFSQWATTFSFYWNTNESRTLRFRLDVGAGRFDVIKATYGANIKRSLVYNSIHPLLKFYMNFVPEKNELFSASVRLFDSVIRLDFWLKILEFAPSHVVRFEFSQISSPLYRKLKPWENDGSSMVGFNYRFGF